jgi:microcystin-dependent protein
MSRPEAGSVPAGTVVAYGADHDNFNWQIEGWTACNGTAFPTYEYPELFEAIGYSNGGSAKEGTYNVPDLRGRFLRG